MYRYYVNTVRLENEAKGEGHRVKYYTGAEFTKKTIEGETMDRLGLHDACCRRHMLTHVETD
jgi:DNA-directed RNA polymerase subunit N (RpoN/RPB10)